MLHDPGAARIVSLLPSATEIVCALGGASRLVGISHECDFPDAIRDRPVLTRSRIDPHGSSRAIDAAVREVIRDALSVYDVDVDQLRALAPDVIVTQDLCEVCAVSIDDVRAVLARLAHRDDVAIVSLRPIRLDDVFGDIDRVGAAIGAPDQAAAARDAMAGRIRAVADRAALAPSRPRVVSVEWIDPLMLGGLWMPELIELAGGVAAGVAPGQPAPTIDGAALRALDPDVVVIKPCGFSLDRTLAERDAIERSLLAHLGAAVRVYATDGNAFFNRPGPRLADSAEILAACIDPDRFADRARDHANVIERLA